MVRCSSVRMSYDKTRMWLTAAKRRRPYSRATEKTDIPQEAAAAKEEKAETAEEPPLSIQ